ncbi:MAG: hypothetical protein ABI797_02980 [Chloroflexota bacterium]
MLLEMELLARDRHERMQREAKLAHAHRLASGGRPQQTNRPNRLRFLSRS